MAEVQKPVTVARHEFIQDLTSIINNSGLPPFIIEPILKDMHRDVMVAAQRQLEHEMKAYNEALEAACSDEHEESEE